MHEFEIPIDSGTVRRLVLEQFPEYAAQEIRRHPSTGTVNAIFRLGDDLYARLPRVKDWADSIEKEARLLTKAGGRLPLAVPELVALGQPNQDYPFRWALYRWIPGEIYRGTNVADETDAAIVLAAFVRQLQSLDRVAELPPAGRLPLSGLDRLTTETAEQAKHLIDAKAVLGVWKDLLSTPPWDEAPVWIHGDLLRPNLLVKDGKLSAVLDFGSSGKGDPAFDLVPAWSVFGSRGRQVFRDELSPDQAVWDRARAYALHQAVLIIPYYQHSNPEFTRDALRTVSEVLADTAASSSSKTEGSR